jgi:hypothetical protein
MFSKYFIVWSVIPFSLLSLSFLGVIKSRTGRRQAEPVRFYFRQFVFSFVILFLADFLILSSLYEGIESVFLIILPEGFLAWVVYPVLLLIAAIIFPGEPPPSDKRLRKIPGKKRKT